MKTRGLPILKRTGRWLGYVAGGLAVFVALVFLTAWIGSAIPRGEKLVDTPSDPVTIMIETNGMHTQFVLPISHPSKDWRELFPSANEWVNGASPTHVAIGFGEREVFLNTPTLADLDIGTALSVAAFGGEGLIRVSNVVNPPLDRDRREMTISGEQYAALVKAIAGDLPELETEAFRSFEFGSYDRDAYYQSSRSYTVFTTCNQWTSDRLADAGIRTGWWTPFSGGVMKWVPPYRTELPSN